MAGVQKSARETVENQTVNVQKYDIRYTKCEGTSKFQQFGKRYEYIFQQKQK
jgi:hypothetical protein